VDNEPVKIEKTPPAVKNEAVKSEQTLSAVYTTDLVRLQCTQQWPNSSKTETVALQKGCEQLLVAHFSDGIYQTELSNLLFGPAAALSAQILRKKPATAPQKKPAVAAADATIAIADPALDAEPHTSPSDGAPAKRSYEALWYKNGHRVGIRQTFGIKTQIFSFGGTRSLRSRRQLQAIGKLVVKDLQAGMNPEAAKEKAKGLAV